MKNTSHQPHFGLTWFQLFRCGLLVSIGLFALPAGAQQLNSNWFSQMRYRTLGPEGNRTDAIVGEPGNPMVRLCGGCLRRNLQDDRRRSALDADLR